MATGSGQLAESKGMMAEQLSWIMGTKAGPIHFVHRGGGIPICYKMAVPLKRVAARGDVWSEAQGIGSVCLSCERLVHASVFLR